MSNCLQEEIDKAKQKSNAAVNCESHSSSNDDQIDCDISELLANLVEVNDEEDDALEKAMEEIPLDGHQTLLEAMANELVNCGDIIWNITGVDCAAHTLQLAIADSIKKLPTNTANVILLCREMSKFLRLVSTKNEMSKLGIEYRLPRLEVSTRWSSLFHMVIDVYFVLFIRISKSLTFSKWNILFLF